MGKSSKGTEASSGESENNWLGSCKTHHVGISPEEDRSGAAGTVGEVQSSEEEGDVEPLEPAAQMRQAFVLEVDCSVPICVIPHL
jgi:hypothetical protein